MRQKRGSDKMLCKLSRVVSLKVVFYNPNLTFVQ